MTHLTTPSQILSVISANELMDMVILPTFPLLSVSEKHAKDILATSKTRTNTDSSRQNIRLISSLTDNSATTLKGCIEVPVTFPNGHRSVFVMAIIQNLAVQIVFGFNHLRKTSADINCLSQLLKFQNPEMNFSVKLTRKLFRNLFYLYSSVT